MTWDSKICTGYDNSFIDGLCLVSNLIYSSQLEANSYHEP